MRRRQPTEAPSLRVVDAPLTTAEQCRTRASTIAADHEHQAGRLRARASSYRAAADVLDRDIAESAERTDQEVERLARAAEALDGAAEREATLPGLRAEAEAASRVVAELTAQAETLTARRDRLAEEIAAAREAENGANPAAAVDARARRDAARQLLRETDDELAESQGRLLDAGHRATYTAGEVNRCEIESAGYAQLAQDILSGVEDERLARQAEIDRQRAAEAEQVRSQQLAAEMLNLPARQAAEDAATRELEAAGWHIPARK